MNYDLVIAHPEGYELDASFTMGAEVTHNQRAAFDGADFVYAKNWSSYYDYGKILSTDGSWQNSSDADATDEQRKVHALFTGATQYDCL